jgi:hypothetical protein
MSIHEFDLDKHIQSIYAFYIKGLYHKLKNDRDMYNYIARLLMHDKPIPSENVKNIDEIAKFISDYVTDNMRTYGVKYNDIYINRFSEMLIEISDALQRAWIKRWVDYNKTKPQTIYKNFAKSFYCMNGREMTIEDYIDKNTQHDNSPLDFFCEAFSWMDSNKTEEYWDSINKLYQALCPIEILDNFGREFTYVKYIF